MKVELFPFQRNAVVNLRKSLAMALNNYRMAHVPQVISFTAPTGSGKTIIMAALFEDILFGADGFAEQPDAIIVWLSDSPQLNEQSKSKVDLKADRIRLSQCVTIADESFDQEVLDDGHIYFLNTQKIGRGANLSKHGDNRQFTIWETLENTAKEKSDRLYFVIDEAHRGMQGQEAGKATSIMQRFLKGSPVHKLTPMPVVIGMSATSARFNKLVEGTTSTIHKVIVTAQEVRASGLLKERIVIKYPEDPNAYNDMAVLQAAADEWKNKCLHWYQYSSEQHYAQVNPIFVIQVRSGNSQVVSTTDIGECIRKIEERTGYHFKENEVVHTFGQNTDLAIGNMVIPYVEPSAIAEDKRVRVVFFKENLSTGWDCPRAETMMSFRVAEDATYIAQLLGRMIRTPLQCRVTVDESLNDVHLFLPYFNADTVDKIINELQNAEGGDIPTVIDDEALGTATYTTLTSRPKRVTTGDGEDLPGLFASSDNAFAEVMEITDPENAASSDAMATPPHGEPLPAITVSRPVIKVKPQTETGKQLNLIPEIDRPAIIKFINDSGLLTYEIRQVRINDYLTSLIDLSRFLTHTNIYKNAIKEVDGEIVEIIRQYIDNLKASGVYEKASNDVLQFKLLAKIFDPFGEKIQNYTASDLFATDAHLDYQLRAADHDLGSCGIPNAYAKQYYDDDDPNACKIDVILFVSDKNCLEHLRKYAEAKFHALNDQYRKFVVHASDQDQNRYKKIVANGDPVSKHNFRLPEVLQVRCDKDGAVEYSNHLYVDENSGVASFKFKSSWEPELLAEEALKPDFVCWLRNIDRQPWSLCIPYEMEGETKSAYPDFIVIRANNQGDGYIIDVLEPHDPSRKDNLGKARAFAKYAEENIAIGRFQLIRKESDVIKNKRFKRLDFCKGEVRKKVLIATNTDDIDRIFDEYGFFE